MLYFIIVDCINVTQSIQVLREKTRFLAFAFVVNIATIAFSIGSYFFLRSSGVKVAVDTNYIIMIIYFMLNASLFPVMKSIMRNG